MEKWKIMRPSWTSLSVWERPSSEDWLRVTSNSFLPIGSIQITISLSKHCVWCVWVILSPASCCESCPAAMSSMGSVWTSGWGPIGHAPFVGPMPQRSRETQSDHMREPDTPYCVSDLFSTACSQCIDTHLCACTHTHSYTHTHKDLFLTCFSQHFLLICWPLLSSLLLTYSLSAILPSVGVSCSDNSSEWMNDNVPDPLSHSCVCACVCTCACTTTVQVLFGQFCNAGLWYPTVCVCVFECLREIFKCPGACLSFCCVSDKSNNIWEILCSHNWLTLLPVCTCMHCLSVCMHTVFKYVIDFNTFL